MSVAINRTTCLIDLPDDTFLGSISPCLKVKELGQMVTVSKRVHSLCISSLVEWINGGNPIHELNDDAVELIPFFAKETVNKQIKWLNLEELENSSILIQGCSSYEHLKFCGDDFRKVTASDIQGILARKRPLKTLRIMPNELEAEALPTLRGLIESNLGVTSLSLSSICYERPDNILWLIPPFGRITGLQELNLGGNSLGSNGERVKWLATLLQANPLLRSLYLQSNFLDDAGLNHLIPPLRTLRYLETLVLSYNKITILGASILADALVNLPSFQYLDLDSNCMKLGGEKEFLIFTNRLNRIQKLSVLSFHDCAINLSKVASFAPSLLEISNLTELDLLANQLSIAALEMFSTQLEKSRLKCLGLSYNEVENQGLKIVGSYLAKTPPCLTELVIRIIPESGPADNKATQQLISGLAKQTFLKHMEFSCFPYNYDFFSKTQISLITEALKQNHAEFISK